MAASLFGDVRQSSNGCHGLSQPASARRTRNVSGQHAQAHIEDDDQIPARGQGLIPLSPPLGSGNPQDEASQAEAGTITSQGATPSRTFSNSSLGTSRVAE